MKYTYSISLSIFDFDIKEKSLFFVKNNFKMSKQFLFLLIAISVFSSCNKKTVFKEVKINNRYCVLMPDYLQPCTDLDKQASLQYKNGETGIYALVIEDRKKEMQNYDVNLDIDSYFNTIAKQGFVEGIKDGKISIPGRQEINKNKALVADVTGKVNEIEVLYKMAIIETPYTFYQVLIWTSAENKEKLQPDMIKIIESFRELPLSADELPERKTLSDSVKITLKY